MLSNWPILCLISVMLGVVLNDKSWVGSGHSAYGNRLIAFFGKQRGCEPYGSVENHRHS